MKRFVALLLAVLCLTRAASAQSTDGPTFDLLKAAHGADSLRRVAAKQQAELTRLARAAQARSDTINRQRRELELLRSARAQSVVASSPAPVSTTDTLRATMVVAHAAPVVVVDTAVSLKSAPVAISPTPSPTVTAPAATSAPATPRAVALPSPTLSGLVQLWLTGGDQGYHNTYRLRRAEVKASGLASPTVSWTVMLDLSKALSATSVTMPNGSLQTTVSQSSRALQDAVISLQASPALRIDAGQQKLPFGLEGAQSSSTLETVERALFASDRARGGNYGDVRDVGVAVRGKWSSAVDYQVGTFNGSGESQNDVDANTAKALVAHLALHPWSSLQVGASGIYAGTAAADAPRRDRDGVDIRFRSNKLLIQAEGVAGHDAALSRHGMYVHTGYHVQPMVDLHVRFDAWDPDVAREADAASATERDYLAGFTWLMPGTPLKAPADLTRRTWSASLSPTLWQLFMNLQTTW